MHDCRRRAQLRLVGLLAQVGQKRDRVGRRCSVLEAENGERVTIPNDVVFVLIGADADLSMLKNLGVETENSKYGEVPVYDAESFETNIPGVYVAGHFTNQRHIKGAIDAGKSLVPELAKRLNLQKETART